MKKGTPKGVDVCVGFKAHMGWTNAVAVRIDTDSPVPVRAERVDLIVGDDPETKEPYHVAGGWHGLERGVQPKDAAAIIARGRARQVTSAKKRLRAFAESLRSSDLILRRAVVLVGRGWLGHDLEDILSSHAHIHVYEGEAIRDATRAALSALEIEFVEQDEKSILGEASRRLKSREAECDVMMKARKPADAKAWRKEERLIALGAWLHRR